MAGREHDDTAFVGRLRHVVHDVEVLELDAVPPFVAVEQSLYAPTEWEAGSLDDRCRMSLIVEALK